MPGLVGLITKKPQGWAEQQLQQMIAVMNHEPSYAVGQWCDKSTGIYAGWASRKGSFSDCMPLHNEKEDRLLLFSGEEYPEPDAKAKLRERGHIFPANNAAYLVHVSEEDSEFPKSLNGRFQGLLVNRTTGVSTLFNDRYGMNRIYYYQSDDTFYFAGEAKAILQVCPALRNIDVRGLAEFVACGCVLENRSLFQGINVVPPASAWTFQSGALTKRNSYFYPSEWENQGCLDQSSYYRELRQVFTRNLPRYFNGNEAIEFLSLEG